MFGGFLRRADLSRSWMRVCSGRFFMETMQESPRQTRPKLTIRILPLGNFLLRAVKTRSEIATLLVAKVRIRERPSTVVSQRKLQERTLGLAQSCNGRALDRVTKQKHRPNRQKLSQKCPKIVSAPPGNFWTFFRQFFDIFRTFCRHSLFLGCPTIGPLQAQSVSRKSQIAPTKRLN